MNVRWPAMVYGTAWKAARTVSLVEAALAAGFTAFDTANQIIHYDERGVGAGLREALRSPGGRRRLFIQTKFTPLGGQGADAPYDPLAPVSHQVLQSMAGSLEHLAIDHVDSYLLHGPVTPHSLERADKDAWRAMEQLVEAGQTTSIGVSNFGPSQLRELWEFAKIKPAVVQNRCFARTRWDGEVRAFCAAHGIVYQAFSLLTANGRELSTEAPSSLARQKGRSTPAVTFAFAMQRGMTPLVGATNSEHMRDALAACSLSLETAELDMLEGLGSVDTPATRS